jgi:hypothetical protein
MWKRRISVIIAVVILIAAPVVPQAMADISKPLDPVLIQCPGSKAHVWDRDQCPRIGDPFSPTGGTGGGPGCQGVVCRVLRGIGGLLGL